LAFCAVITPNASLSRGGFLGVLVLIGGISFAAGLMFVLKGAWPVVPFLGLDVLLVWLAFRAYRDKAKAFEEVTLSADELAVRRVSPDGSEQRFGFNPYWVRLDRRFDEDEGLVRLSLTSHGRSLVIAHFLSPPERERFARALEGALAGLKAAGPVQPRGCEA